MKRDIVKTSQTLSETLHYVIIEDLRPSNRRRFRSTIPSKTRFVRYRGICNRSSSRWHLHQHEAVWARRELDFRARLKWMGTGRMNEFSRM